MMQNLVCASLLLLPLEDQLYCTYTYCQSQYKPWSEKKNDNNAKSENGEGDWWFAYIFAPSVSIETIVFGVAAASIVEVDDRRRPFFGFLPVATFVENDALEAFMCSASQLLIVNLSPFW